MGILVCAYSNSCCWVTVQIRQSRTQTQEVNVIYGHYCNGIKIEICNTMFDCSFLAPSLSFPRQSFINLRCGVSITLDHYNNMYADDLTSLLPCLAPCYLLLAHTERRLGSRVSFTQGCSSKKASREKDPPQHHHFISLCILAMRGVFSGVRGL